MDSSLYLSLPPPTTPSPAAPLNAPKKKKRTKLLCFQLQPSPAKPKTVARKPDPSAPKITMPCSECGRKFWSWKALYGHMRCHPNRQWRGINPPPHFRRPPQTSPEEYEAASCLLLLANCYSPTPRNDRDAVTTGLGHTCGICFKVFSTGQALGGHKRCHLDKNTAVSTSGGGLDLNLPIDQVEDMGGGGGGGGCGGDDALQLVLRLGF